MANIEHACPRCAGKVRPPYPAYHGQGVEITTSGFGQVYCATCEDYIRPIAYDPLTECVRKVSILGLTDVRGVLIAQTT